MKKLIVFGLVLYSTIAAAQTTKNLGDFDEVKVFDRISVELIASNENKIEITGRRSGDVELVNNNGELKIRMPFPKLLEGDEVSAKLYFKKLESIDGSEGAVITSGKKFAQTSVEITAKEGARITLDLDVSKVEVKAVTGGIINLTGIAKNLDATLGTGGILNAKDLSTVQTDVSIKAGGEADVRASELVDADVKAGGTITIYGKPKQINKETALGGTITESKR